MLDVHRPGMITSSEIANSNGFLLLCGGDLDVKDLCVEIRVLQQKFPALPTWYFAIADLSRVAKLNITAADFDLLVEQNRKLAQITRPGLPLAVVARNDLTYGIARMFQSALDLSGWELHVFRDRAPADAWLRHQVLSTYGVEVPPWQPDGSIVSAASQAF